MKRALSRGKHCTWMAVHPSWTRCSLWKFNGGRSQRCLSQSERSGPDRSLSRRNAQRLQTFERVRVFPNESDERGGLLVRLAASLFPPFEGPRVDSNLEREYLPRHVERFACLPNEIRVDARNADRL